MLKTVGQKRPVLK